MASIARAALDVVVKNKTNWTKLGFDKKAAYLRRAIESLQNVTDDWAKMQLEKVQRGNPADPQWNHVLADQYVVTSVLTGKYLHLLANVYDELATKNTLDCSHKVETICNEKVVNVFPLDVKDRLAAPGFTGYLHFSADSALERGKELHHEGAVSVVLGAGNYAAPVDILYKMFNENKVVVYKCSPVNGEVSSVFVPKVFQALIEDGYLQVVTGDAEVGSSLLSDQDTADVVLTGGVATYDRIMWGPPSEQAQRKSENRPVFTKPFEAELGCVNPVLITPTDWPAAELDHQAAQIAAVRMTNSGHICAAPQVVIVARDWPQRQKFFDLLQKHLSAYPPMPNWYPGTASKYHEMVSHYPRGQAVKSVSGIDHQANTLDPLLIPDITADGDDFLLKNEAFTPVIGELPIDCGMDVSEYFQTATRVCNERLWGNLSATVLVDSGTLSSRCSAVQQAVADLRYGAVGVNVWGGNVIVFPQLCWGAFPGNPACDIQSGCGKAIGNALMYSNITKAVLWSPTVSPVHIVPPASTAQHLLQCQRLARFAATNSTWDLIKLLSAALVGY